MSNEEQKEQEVKLTPAEQKAAERGWKPESEWQGDEGAWVDASTFNRMGELMDRISSQSKELKEVRGTIDEFKKHNKERDKVALEKAKKQLIADKAYALENDDFQTAAEIDDKILDVKDEIRDFDKPSGNQATGEDPFAKYFKETWVSDNSWYNQSTAMRRDADQLGSEYIADHPNASPAELFDFVSKQIKVEYPDKFKNQRREEPGAVGSGSGAGKGNRNARLNLTDEEYQCGTRFVKQGLYDSLEEYAADLNNN